MGDTSTRRGSPGPVGVLIVDPHTKLRAALEAALAVRGDIAVVAAVGAFDEALVAVRLRRPHVALVDVTAFGHRGMAGLAELRDAWPLTAILVMGIVDDPSLERAAIRYGAVGRILKDMPAAELAAAVRAAAGRAPRLRIVPPDA